jgi:hypothetical protein
MDSARARIARDDGVAKAAAAAAMAATRFAELLVATDQAGLLILFFPSLFRREGEERETGCSWVTAPVAVVGEGEGESGGAIRFG